MDNFVHLHNHSTYSFTDGYGTPEQYVKRAKELGQIALGVTDHGNISAHYRWYQECEKAGIRPLLGCELYVAPDQDISDDRKYYHILAIATTNEGYSNLLKLVTKGWQEGFKRKPLVPMADIIKLQKGLVITSGCPSGKICQLIAAGQLAKAKEELIMMKNSIEHFYIEVAPWTFKMGNDLLKPLWNLSEELGIPMVATNDCHYVLKDESLIQETLLCIQSNDQMSNPSRWKFDQDDFYLKSRKEMEDSFAIALPGYDFTAALDNTIKISKIGSFKFPEASPLKFPIEEHKKEEMFKQLCRDGLKKRNLDSKKEYIERLEYEIDLIIKKEFIDYFLIVQDLVNWAKNNGILVGPARGSSAGSLVCYALRITEVDPIQWELMFERFIDINREDLPDIDVDFEDERRPDIKRYLESKYGIDKVSAISTYSTFKGKNIIQDFGRIYRMPFDRTEKLKSVIIERSGGDSRASFTLMDTFEQFELAKQMMADYPMLKDAPKLEGQLRNMSSHASGMVVSNEPLTNFCAVYRNKGENTMSMDYHDASDLGLVKLDILGLNTLTCISKALKFIKERHKKDIDIYNLPLDDKKVFDGFNDPKRLFGIFQFDGQAVNQVCRQIKPRNFEELSAINALSRPGPMHGMDLEYNQPITSIYISRKDGKLPLKYVHPLMESITKDTQGVVIYQEQVMKTMREIGRMSWKDTAEIRRLISRSVGVERFNTFKDRFKVGAKENGLSDQEAENIWAAICTFGSWAFNKSHSVSYSIISYWTMWLKMYYPIEYYAAMTSTILHEDKVKKILKEYSREGFKLLPIDINASKQDISIDGDLLRLGFSNIKGMGEATAQDIVKHQPYTNLEHFSSTSSAGKAKTETLAKLGAFKSIGGTKRKELTLFGEKEIVLHPDTISLEERIKLCPFSVELKIEDEWKEFINQHIKFPVFKIEELDSSHESQVVMGIAYDKNLKDKIEEALTRGKEAPVIVNGKSKYFNFFLEDDSDFVTVRVSVNNFDKFSSLVFEQIGDGDILMIKGKMGDGIRMFFANEIVCLNHLKKKIEKKETLTESELILTGKLWKNFRRRN